MPVGNHLGKRMGKGGYFASGGQMTIRHAPSRTARHHGLWENQHEVRLMITMFLCVTYAIHLIISVTAKCVQM